MRLIQTGVCLDEFNTAMHEKLVQKLRGKFTLIK